MRRFSLCLIFALAGCGAQSPDTSESKYILGHSSYAGLTRKVSKPTISVCYSDRTNSQRHKDDVRYSILEWVDALRDVSDEELTQNVDIVGPNDNCDVYVNVGNYSYAYTQLGSVPSVQITYDGWYGSKTVTLHEFGHAFGLLDTYAGSGGSCQSGQPDSVMCWASYDELKNDDIQGLRKMYERVKTGRMGSQDPQQSLTLR